MKALGIIRNLDSLGRVVIPKEVRRSQGWEEGQAMEMFMDGDKLVLGAYRLEDEKDEIIQQLNSVIDTTNNEAAKKMVQNAIEFLNRG